MATSIADYHYLPRYTKLTEMRLSLTMHFGQPDEPVQNVITGMSQRQVN